MFDRLLVKEQIKYFQSTNNDFCHVLEIPLNNPKEEVKSEDSEIEHNANNNKRDKKKKDKKDKKDKREKKKLKKEKKRQEKEKL